MGIERTGSERKMGDVREKEGSVTQESNMVTEGLRLRDGPVGGYRRRIEERLYSAGLKERTHEEIREMAVGRKKDRSGTQDSNRATEDSTYEHRWRDGPGRGNRRRAEERLYNAGLQERTREEMREHVTRSGKRYNRMERDTGREGLSLCDKVRQEVEDIVEKLDRQDTSTVDIQRIVREGLWTLSDTVEREVVGMMESMAETVRKKVEVEVGEIKDMVKGVEEMTKRNEELVLERMKRLEERLKESEDRESSARERLERVEDRLCDNEGEKGQDRVSDRIEKIEEKINVIEHKLENMRKDKDREKELEDRVKNNEERMEWVRKSGDRTRKKESMREMKDKIEEAGKKLKYFGVDHGTGSMERRELVNRTIRCLQDSVAHKDKERFRTVIGRTRVSLLGKGTVVKQYKGRTINTMPVLLECRTEEDKLELGEILQEAGWHSSFERPEECMEFVREVKEEIKKLGYVESTHDIKIRPEIRRGRAEIRGEVRDKEGGRFRTVAFWEAPPVDRTLWDSDQLRPRTVGYRKIRTGIQDK